MDPLDHSIFSDCEPIIEDKDLNLTSSPNSAGLNVGENALRNPGVPDHLKKAGDFHLRDPSLTNMALSVPISPDPEPKPELGKRRRRLPRHSVGQLSEQFRQSMNFFALPPMWNTRTGRCRTRRIPVRKNMNGAGVNSSEHVALRKEGACSQEVVVGFHQPDPPPADIVPQQPSHATEVVINPRAKLLLEEETVPSRPANPLEGMVGLEPVRPDESTGIQEGQNSGSSAIEPMQQMHIAEEGSVDPPKPRPRKQAAADGQRADVIPDANLISAKRRGGPPKLTAATQEKAVNQKSSVRRRRRDDDFVLPTGWRTEIRYRQTGRSKGNKDKYYIEEETNHACRSRQEVKKYIQSKTK